MSQRKGNAFQDRNVPGDQRLLDAISRRTPIGVNQQMTHVPGGVILTPKKKQALPIVNAHPWKVTSNGDDTVNVAKGKTLGVFSQDEPAIDNLPSFTMIRPTAIYPGGDVTVTGDGYIVGYTEYAVQPAIYTTLALTSVDNEEVLIGTSRIRAGIGINVEFMAALPDGSTPWNFYFVIAEVSLTDGVAVVESQEIHHNPTLDSYFASYA